MSTVDHVEALKAKHASLEHAIDEENSRPYPNDDAICSLRSRKLPDQGRDQSAEHRTNEATLTHTLRIQSCEARAPAVMIGRVQRAFQFGRFSSPCGD